MGSGFLRRRKLAQLQTAVAEMKKQTDEILNDPESAVSKMTAPLVKQLQQAMYQQNRLSALVCAILDQNEGKLVVKRGAIERFQGHRLMILNETPDTDDGVNPETDITFSYRAEILPKQEMPQNQPLLTASQGIAPEVPATQVVENQ